MNERIEELAEQAGAWDYYDINDSFDCKMLHKFAELIVQECAEVAGCNGHVSGFSLGDLIKQHFGVEE